MTDASDLDVAVERELLRVAMRNAKQSVPLQIGAVGVVVAIGVYGGEVVTAVIAAFIGAVVAVSRFIIAQSYQERANPAVGDIRQATRLIELNALLGGLLWAVCSFGLYPYLQGTMTTSYMAIAIGSATSAVLFMPLIGRSYIFLITLSFGSLVFVSLFMPTVRSYPAAGLGVLLLITMARAGKEIASMTRLAVRHSLEKDIVHAALVKSKEDAEAANVAKSQFLAMVSHEIRTPMNGVLGSLELLRYSTLTKGQRNLVKAAASSGSALLNILNDVLDHAKIEAGKLSLTVAPMSMHGTVASVITLFLANAQSKGLWLNLELPSDVEDWVIGDAQRIKQVLMNLIGNAIKFTKRGGVTVAIAPLRGYDEAAGYAFEIRDTGVGMTAESIGHLFQPFKQVSAGSKRTGGGTGLGLVISQRIAEVMGTAILVKSSFGRGSVFAFELWLKKDVAKEHSVLVDSSLGGLDEIAANTGDVLVVEDDEVSRMIARETLLSLGMTVYEATNGAEAVRMMSARSYDLVVMDCMMPVMNGYEAVAAIRQREAETGATRTPIIALTANAYDEDVSRSRASGMDSHISKPYTRSQMRDVLVTWL